MILNTSGLQELSRIMAAKTLNNSYRWQTVRFELSLKGKKTNVLKDSGFGVSISLRWE